MRPVIDLANVSAGILLVAPRDGLLDALRRRIENEGYEVLVATDLQLGRSRLKNFDCDLAIVELDPSPPLGFELLRRLCATRTSALVLTLLESTKVQDRIRCLNLGADDCMSKPFVIG